MATDTATLSSELAQYYGGDQIYKHSLNPRFNYTAGVRHFAQNAGQGAYWLLDLIGLDAKVLKTLQEEGFAVVELKVSEDSGAVLTAKLDSNEAPFFKKLIRYTDTPHGVWKFYLEQTVVGVTEVTLMMLPRER